MTYRFTIQRCWLACVTLTQKLVAGCATNTPAPDTGAVSTAPVVVQKSPNDKKDYRYLVLPYELRVLLVSDPSTDRAAASLTVLRGYYHEPRE